MSDSTITPVPSIPADPPVRRRWPRALAAYGAVLALTVLTVALHFQLWHVDIRAPFTYEGDGLQHMMFTKAFVENGWYLHNPSLGAPGEMDLREFPAADVLPGLLTKALGLYTHRPALINNLLYLLTFPLTSLGAFFACRRMGISNGPAGLASLLYAFLPYHLERGTGHLYLSCYFVVAPAVLVAWWVATGRLLDRADGGGAGRVGLAAAICAVASTSGLYYPFFAGLFMAAASCIALFKRRDCRHFAAGSALAALLAAGVLLCLLPTLLFLHDHPHPPVSQRAAGETEIYALKIVQLVLPSESHPLNAFRLLKKTYNEETPLVNENTTAALGLLGAAGCLGLLGWLFFRPTARPPTDPSSARTPRGLRETLDVLCVFNGVAVLYGTIGGVGMLFSLFVSAQLRSLNRISIFIGFFSLAAVAACLDWWGVRPGRSLAVRAAGWAGLGLLLTAGLLDQLPWGIHVAGHVLTALEYRADGDFFRQIEASVPAGTMIFQLPYAGFPETTPPTEAMGSDSHLRGYLHTRGLRWSYGAVKNTPADLWQQRVAALPLEEGVRALALAGFGGVFLERDGYLDHGAASEAELRRLLGPPTAERPARLFFNLADYTRVLRASLTDAQWQAASARARVMIFARFGAGFADLENGHGQTWRWCGREGRLTIMNGGDTAWRVRVSFDARTGRSDSARLTMRGGVAETWTLTKKLQRLAVVLEVPPGNDEIRFSCDGLPIDAPMDSREMVWSPLDFQLEDLEPIPPPAAPDAAGQSR